MAKKASSMEAVRKALPEVQKAVRADIAARVAVGEMIAGVDDGVVISSTQPRLDLAIRRHIALQELTDALTDKVLSERKSAA